MRIRSAPAWTAVVVVLALLVWGAYGIAREVVQQRHETAIQAHRLTGGDPDRGEAAIGKYGCGACHEIPGIPGARGRVGPPLKGVGGRIMLAGRLNNTPPNMMLWIQHPQLVEPGTDMPELGMSDRETRDIAAYLYTRQ
ncbi:MAG: c-type cytochrome [Ignavibacteriales bacterium]